MDLGGVGIGQSDADDLVIGLPLVDQLQAAQYAAGCDGSHGQRVYSHLHDVEGIVVRVVAFRTDHVGILPRLGNVSVIEEGSAVRVVPRRTVLVGILHDGVALDGLHDFHLGRDSHGNFRHQVDDPLLAAARFHRNVVPQRIVLLMLQFERRGAELTLVLGMRIGVRLHPWTGPGNPPVRRVDILVIIHDPLPSLRNHEPTRDAIGLDQIVRNVGGTARTRTVPRQQSHLGSRNRNEIVHPRVVGDLHHVIGNIVHDLDEAQHLHVPDSGRILEDVPPVIAVVQIVVRVAHGVGTALHAGGIPPHDEVRRSCGATRFGVELNLRRTRVHHRRGPYRHDGRIGVQSSGMAGPRVQHLFVLLHAHVQRDVVRFGPSSQGAQPEYRILEPLGAQILSGAAHQIGVSRVGGIAGLEGVHGIGALGGEFVAEFLGSLAPLVQSVVVFDPVQQFYLAADQIVAARVDMVDVGMVHVNDAKHAGDDFLLPIGVDFGIAENGDPFAHLGDQGDSALVRGFNVLLGEGGARQRDGDGHTHAAGGLTIRELSEIGLHFVTVGVAGQVEWIDQDGVEVESLEEGPFAHETAEGRRPSLANGLEPIEIDIGDEHLGQRGGLSLPLRLELLGNVKIHHQITVGVGQTGRTDLGGALQNPVPFQSPKQ
mmetsp:Transcript_17517/g.51107  ORF Transcript_17517/g.51107 Transcript_17517/m.51107 type:complete len:654 (-) Transcript_17517:1277-3238(-)